MDRAEAIGQYEELSRYLDIEIERGEKDGYKMTICKMRRELYSMAIAALREQDVTDINDGRKWISVKERLPEKDECVWCFSNKNGGYMFRGYRGWITGEWMECGSMHIADVTHWMPLPEPPEGGAQE